MLNEALLKLEQDIDQMMEHNKELTEKVERITQERDQLSEKVQQLENDNETLLLDGIDQEEKQEQTLNRIKGMLNRFNASESETTNAVASSQTQHQAEPTGSEGQAQAEDSSVEQQTFIAH